MNDWLNEQVILETKKIWDFGMNIKNYEIYEMHSTNQDEWINRKTNY